MGLHPPQRVKLGSLTLCIVVKRQRNIQKSVMDAQSVFFSVIVLVLFDSSLFKFSSLLLLDVLSSTFNEHPATDGGFSLMQEFLLDFFKKSPTCAFKN